MHILHVIPGIAGRYGGPSTVIRPMVEALNRRPGVHVEVAATDADGAGRKLIRSDLPCFPAPLHLFRRNCSEQWKFSAGLLRWLRQHAREYDLFHVHALWTFSTAAACAAARWAGVPVILRPCGMLSAYTWGRSTWKKRLYWAAVERRNLLTARRFHVTSNAEATEVARLRLPGAVPVVIPHGMESAAWETEVRPDQLRRLCGGRAGNRPIILFLSRLHPKKGVTELLLPAFARLQSDAFLAIAGGADEHAPEYEAKVQAAVADLGLSNRVALLGPVASNDRWALFDGAAVFVLPSYSENFGIVVTEAMARGVPVVVSQEVQACEHVLAAGAGRVVPLTADSVARGIDDLLVQPAMAGENGRRYVRDHLAWDGIADRILAMYRECLV